jgi:hypothetical protein
MEEHGGIDEVEKKDAGEEDGSVVGAGEDERVAEKEEEAPRARRKRSMLLIRRSFQASRVEIVGRHALHCINRRENGAPNNDKPFDGKQKIRTIRKYANVFTQILRYIWRTADMPERPIASLSQHRTLSLLTS